jgi:hypothetical protein
MTWGRIVERIDPKEARVRRSQRFDPGLEHGGLGTVYFKVYAEKPG